MLKFDIKTVEYIDNIHYTALPSPLRQPLTMTAMGHFKCGGNYFTKRDSLQECLFIYTLGGCGEMEYHNSKALLEPGTAVLIHCGNPQYYATHGDFWQFAWVHFHGSLAFEYEEAVNEGGLWVNKPSKAEFMQVYMKLKRLAESGSSQGEISVNLHLLLELLLQSKEKSCEAARIETAADYIKSNFRNDLDIGGLASMAGFSKFYFIRQFKKHYNSTPYQYLLSARISEAKKLLTSTDLPVYEVALESGFSDSKAFIYNFKNSAGTTPAKYRSSYL